MIASIFWMNCIVSIKVAAFIHSQCRHKRKARLLFWSRTTAIGDARLMAARVRKSTAPATPTASLVCTVTDVTLARSAGWCPTTLKRVTGTAPFVHPVLGVSLDPPLMDRVRPAGAAEKSANTLVVSSLPSFLRMLGCLKTPQQHEPPAQAHP